MKTIQTLGNQLSKTNVLCLKNNVNLDYKNYRVSFILRCYIKMQTVELNVEPDKKICEKNIMSMIYLNVTISK